MPNTTNYNWATPADTDLVKDGAAAIRTLGSSADTTVKNLNPGTTAGDIDFHEYLGTSWGILFSHPADFTPVCTTELGRTAQLEEEFKKRNVKVLAVSVDGLEKHESWVKDINETQHCTVGFPIIADENREVAGLYDMIHPNASATFTVRSLFIIGPDKTIKLFITYPASTGRNFVEVLRVIDSLQQKVGNYKIEPPGIFLGRGSHPKIGRIKKRIMPEDIILNLDKEAPVPKPNVPGKWKEVLKK